MQAPALAATVAGALRHHYDAEGDATAFWDLHATLDEHHAEWLARALAEVPGAEVVLAPGDLIGAVAGALLARRTLAPVARASEAARSLARLKAYLERGDGAR